MRKSAVASRKACCFAVAPSAGVRRYFARTTPFHSLFAVKSGSFKTYVPRFDHPDQVVGFHLVGEMLGCEGMAGGNYPYTARALENSSVCELRLEKLSDAGRSIEELQKGIIELQGKEVAFSHELIASMVHQSSEQRVAGFLLSLSNRLQRRGMPSSEFNMGMSRSDIGNFLGLAGETVSRVPTKFQKQGLIKLNHKRVTILDAAAVQHFANDLD
ncbi:helix-turn-helix domain-containing protein [Solemya velesiana gill symbiont]|uniref:helix-turn-helix domain-containing protein n=1 Tax=Solemya velesiana gill symbiont TaxID=1918948 RepID=UPI000996E2AE|nr:helix-turn-helix domain-containing protein [Solemya velesiana gill symbiont]